MTAEKVIGVSAFLLGIIGGLWWQGELDIGASTAYMLAGILIGVLIASR